jgi:3-dehydroquinate dehydratase-1
MERMAEPVPEADLLELRVDHLRAEGVDSETIIKSLKRRRNPVLLTLRTTIEGGIYPWKSTERILLFEKLIPYGDAVDLELVNMKYVHPLLQQARNEKRGVILSSHSLQRKITFGKAVRIIEEFRKYRVQAYKLATLVRTREDLNVLVQVLLEYPKLRLALMGTGPLAGLSRLVLPPLGAKLAYGYLDEPAAPGQPSLEQVAEFVEFVPKA